MTAEFTRAAAAAAVLALVLTGCTATAPPVKTAQPAGPAPMQSGIPVPVLKVGDPLAVDLNGDGRATITVVSTDVAAGPMRADPSPQGKARLVVTVKILLDKAGKPITGGPENFRFRDAQKVLYPARTNKNAFPPELAPVNLTTTGQQAQGKIIFDVAADLVNGGQIQLVTGNLIHAIWAI